MKENIENLRYAINGVQVQLTKASTRCRATVNLTSELYSEDHIGSSKEFKDRYNSLIINVKSLDSYSCAIKKGLKTKWRSFNIKWHKLEYQRIPDTISLELINEDIELVLVVHKNKFIPSDWESSYDSHIRRLKSELYGPTRLGYVNNRHTETEYKINNARNPFSGGRFSPK